MILDLARILVVGLATAAVLFLGMMLAAFGGPPGALAVAATLLAGTLFALWLWKRSGKPGPLALAPWPQRVAGLRRLVESVFLVCTAGLLVGLIGAFAAARPPSQASVASRFERHRADYERLREMVLADGLQLVDGHGETFSKTGHLSGTSPAASGIAAGRAAIYKRLMRSADVPWIRAGPDGALRGFYTAGWGFGGRGWRLCLTWSAKKPESLVPTIDGWRPQGRGKTEVVWSPIGGDWYVEMIW